MENIISPEVSVLLPAYNAAPYIGEAIESILNQTFSNFELIINDDCSTDKTWDLIQNYAKRDARILAYRNKENQGIAGNRNKLVLLARGEYIVWQDADDISMLNRVQKQFEFMQRHPDVAIVGGWLQFFNRNGVTSVRQYAATDAPLRQNIFRCSPVAQPAAMIRKKCLDEAGPYDLKCPPAEDLDMSFRLGAKYKFANLPEVVLRYRENTSSATFTRLKTMELNTIDIRRKYSRGYGYVMTIGDKVYHYLHYVSIYFVPPRLKIRLFNFFRNSGYRF